MRGYGSRIGRAVVACAWLAALPAVGQSQQAVEESTTVAVRDCAEIEDEEQRLACYDGAAARSQRLPGGTYLERHWDLNNEALRFRPWPHHPNYVIPARASSDPNDSPFRERRIDPASSTILDIQPVEAKFQLSFKTKVWRDLLGGPGDLWFGYTQQSHFQVYNRSESRPFRETNYQPEFIVTFPARQKWGKWTWRVVGVGVVHQSNGRADPLSRSWDRLYGLFAGESGNISVEFRPWLRVDDPDLLEDDNPEIEKQVGRFEALLVWKHHRHVMRFRGRSNLDSGDHHGSAQLEWFYPVRPNLRLQMQVFHGRGESLIDYNFSQTTYGVGLVLFDPF